MVEACSRPKSMNFTCVKAIARNPKSIQTRIKGRRENYFEIVPINPLMK